ncbi:MAG: TetR/AcrR family transcriptional regulator [Atopobiaceae bacterium]
MAREHRSEDRRVIKTRRAIRAALLELLASEEVRDITARDVADRALISKKTFLAHYGSVSSAVDEMETEAVESVAAVLDEAEAADGEEGFVHAAERIASLAEDKATTMGALLHTRVKDELVARIECLVRDRIAKASGPDAGTLMPDFVAGGLVSAMRRWIQDGRRLSARELVQKAQALVGTLRKDGLPDAEPTDIA